MTDEQTAAAIVADQMNAVSETAMEAAIVRALQQARESAFMAHVADQSTRNYCHTASDVSDALCREMEASNIMGSHLWWGEMYRRIGLELCCAFNSGRADALVDQKPPPGHIIDDQGVVRKLLAPLVYTESGAVAWMEHVPPPREAAEAEKEAKHTNDKCKVCRCHISGHHGPAVGCEGCGGSCKCMLTKKDVAAQ